RTVSNCLPVIKDIVYFREQSTLAAPLLAPPDIDPIRELRTLSTRLKMNGHAECRIEIAKLQEMKEKVVSSFNNAITCLSVNLIRPLDVRETLSITTEEEANKIKMKTEAIVAAVRKDTSAIAHRVRKLRHSTFDIA
ncbi:hypothetical protein PFISCL1PPCAC_7188, partial [Pristionchus fissidentatus]